MMALWLQRDLRYSHEIEWPLELKVSIETCYYFSKYYFYETKNEWISQQHVIIDTPILGFVVSSKLPTHGVA